MALSKEWADKNEIATELGLGPRRVQTLAKEHGWASKPGTKVQGQKLPPDLYRVADVRAYQERQPALLEDGTPAPVALTPAKRTADTSGLVSVLERILAAIAPTLPARDAAVAALAEPSQPDQPAKPGDAPTLTLADPRSRFVPLHQAAKLIGVSRKTLDDACDSGVLSFVMYGGGRRVRLRDIEEIDFGFAGRARGAGE